MKTHLLKYDYWNNGVGKFYCGDTAAIGKKANQWWIPARLLNLSLVQYIALLITNFNAEIKRFKNNTLVYCFKTENDAFKFCNYINQKAKISGFYF